MNRICWLLLALSLLWSCDVQLPNGVFKCNDDAECPSGFSCEPDALCWDAACEELLWEEIRQNISDTYTSLGDEPPEISCGDFVDGCGRSVEGPACPPGETCSNFSCGCAENTCEDVECGPIARLCASGDPIDCGTCLGAKECVEGRCVCPPGEQCETGCSPACGAGEICVDGLCCTQLFPCQQNECSPPAGFSDGCSGVVYCEPCDANQRCVRSAEGQPFQCASVDACGDIHEPNDDESIATALCTDGSCQSKIWSVKVAGASLRGEADEDHYMLRIPDTNAYSVHVKIDGLDSVPELRLKYRCANGSDGKLGCSGSSSNDYCIEDGKNELALYRDCDSSGMGTLYLVVGSKSGEFKGSCDVYSLTVWSEEYDD